METPMKTWTLAALASLAFLFAPAVASAHCGTCGAGEEAHADKHDGDKAHGDHAHDDKADKAKACKAKCGDDDKANCEKKCDEDNKAEGDKPSS